MVSSQPVLSVIGVNGLKTFHPGTSSNTPGCFMLQKLGETCGLCATLPQIEYKIIHYLLYLLSMMEVDPGPDYPVMPEPEWAKPKDKKTSSPV